MSARSASADSPMKLRVRAEKRSERKNVQDGVKYALDAMNHAMISLDMTQKENASLHSELRNTKKRLSDALAGMILLRVDFVRSRQVLETKRQAFRRWSERCRSMLKGEWMKEIRTERISHAITKLTHVFRSVESRKLRAAVELWQEIARQHHSVHCPLFIGRDDTSPRRRKEAWSERPCSGAGNHVAAVSS